MCGVPLSSSFLTIFSLVAASPSLYLYIVLYHKSKHEKQCIEA